ncbi:MAG: phage capsid protein, partial [Chthoniobacterales bacterium]
LPQFYPTEFDTNWEFLVQQRISRLAKYVTIATINGKEKTFNQLGALSMQRVTTRAGKTRVSDTPTDKRWIRPFPYDLATVFDEWDEEFLGNTVLPTSETMQAHVMAYGRTCDQVIINGLEGITYSGESGVTPNSLGNSQIVGNTYVANGGTPATSGLTLAKLVKAKSILAKNEAFEEGIDELIFVYSQQQLDDLLNNVNEIKDIRYNDVKALVDGANDRFMGFRFVRLELLTKNTTIRNCYAYVKKGIKFGDENRKSHMDILPTQSHALQIRTVASLAACRMEEKYVVQVQCDEFA